MNTVYFIILRETQIFSNEKSEFNISKSFISIKKSEIKQQNKN